MKSPQIVFIILLSYYNLNNRLSRLNNVDAGGKLYVIFGFGRCVNEDTVGSVYMPVS